MAEHTPNLLNISIIKHVVTTLPLEFNSTSQLDFDILFSTKTSKINEIKMPFVKKGQRQARNCL